MLFETNPVEFKADSVTLDVKGVLQEMPNDFVWIFAGGTPPNDFLKKIGVGFGARDLTLEASKEAKEAEACRETARSSRSAGAVELAEPLHHKTNRNCGTPKLCYRSW